MIRLLPWVWAIPAILGGCDPREIADCRQNYLSVHRAVSATDTRSLERVEESLAAVQGALGICERARLREEVVQLNKALRKLQGHHAYLIHNEPHKDVGPAQVEELSKTGDSTCPTGQLYQYRKYEKKIRCIGPQIFEMNWREAETYFESRGYKVSKQENRLRAEYGSESYNYTFARAGDTQRATCITLFAPPGIGWQEMVSKATGVSPMSLKAGAPVNTGRKKLALGLIEDPTQAIIRLGECEE